MKDTIVMVAIVSATVIAPCYSTLRANQATSSSVLDGVYTEEQAKRGEAVYGDYCLSCHGATLAGTMDSAQMAPALTGEEFIYKWTDATVHDLFQKVKDTMPSDAKGTLTVEQTADVLAYVLSFDKFPAGKTELPNEAEALKKILIEAPKP